MNNLWRQSTSASNPELRATGRSAVAQDLRSRYTNIVDTYPRGGGWIVVFDSGRSVSIRRATQAVTWK